MTGMTKEERLKTYLDKIEKETRSAMSSASNGLLLLQDEVNGSDDTPIDVVDPLPTPDPHSTIIVGKASGKPGDTVLIEVLGSTHAPVNGIALAIGCERAVRLVNSDFSDELKDILNVTSPQKIVKQQTGMVEKQNFIQVALLFFSQVFTQEEIEGDASDVPLRPKRTIVSVQIPAMTPIYRMNLKIPQDAQSGERYALTPGFDYGRPLSQPDGRMTWLSYPTMYTTPRDAAEEDKYGIRPELVSGWIDVE